MTQREPQNDDFMTVDPNRRKLQLREVAGSAAGRYDGIGGELRAARMRNRLDLDAIGVKLRINAAYLLAIEEGRFGDLPGDVYVYGFLRTYSQHLGLDPEVVIQQYKTEAANPKPTAKLDFPSPMDRGRLPTMRILLVSIVLAGLVYGGWSMLTEENRQTAERVAPLPERFANLAGTPSGTSPATAPAAVTPEPAPLPPPAMTAAPATAAPATAAPTSAEQATPAAVPPSEVASPAPTQPAVAPPPATAPVVAAAPPAAAPAPAAPAPIVTALPVSPAPVPAAAPVVPASPAPQPVLTPIPSPAATAAPAPPAPAPATPPPAPAAASPAPTPAAAPVVGEDPRRRAGDGSASSDTATPAPLPGQEGVARRLNTLTERPGASAVTPSAPAPAPAAPAPVASLAPPVAAPPSPAPAAAVPANEPLSEDEEEADAPPPPRAAAVPDSPRSNSEITISSLPPQAAPSPAAPLTAAPAVPAVPPPSTQAFGATAEPSRITVRAEIDSWVQITTTSGQPVFARMLRSGDSYLVPDRPGLRLMTGNAGGLRITVDGNPTPPIGMPGSVVRDVALEPERLRRGNISTNETPGG